jgi:hypothetical protein
MTLLLTPASGVSHRSLLLLFILIMPNPLAGQDLSFRLGRTWAAQDYLTLWLGYGPPRLGPMEVTLTAGTMGTSSGTRYGLGFDLGVGVSRWTIVAGVGGGLGSGSEPLTWGSWSAGTRYTLLDGPVILGAEGRYRRLSGGSSSSGVELLGMVGFRIGRKRAAGSGGSEPPAPAAALRSTVVTTARQARGRPYLWGGSDENGFDCSGLIQHAYAQAGIALARRSVDQARAGVAVDRRVELLAPGDILTFAEAGGQVSHVGLYLGDGEFIHSTNRGVMVSAISSAEPVARWWITRWVGARRIVLSP